MSARVLALGVVLALGGGCSSTAPRAPGPDESASLADPLVERARRVLGPLPAPASEDGRRVALGRRLFFDTRLSADGTIGCASCHLPERYGADGRARSRGARAESARNCPTVFNADGQLAQHWRGERASLEDEATRALVGPAFGLASLDEVARRLGALDGYREAFAAAFPADSAPLGAERFGDAVAAFERTLRTPAPLDAFMAGDVGALGARARAGLAAFLDLGCASCHGGPLLGGASFEKFGVVRDYRPLTGSSGADAGRLDVTGLAADRDVFKVPPLRNVTHTAPYFHDGSVASLEDAVRVMAAAQLGRELAPAEIEPIVAFLGALGGELPRGFSPEPVAALALPATSP